MGEVFSLSLSEILLLPFDHLRIMIKYVSKYPPGWRAEVAVAMNTATLCNINRDPKKKKSPFKVSDFSAVAERLTRETRRVENDKNLLKWLGANEAGNWDQESTEEDQGGNPGAGTFGVSQDGH